MPEQQVHKLLGRETTARSGSGCDLKLLAQMAAYRGAFYPDRRHITATAVDVTGPLRNATRGGWASRWFADNKLSKLKRASSGAVFVWLYRQDELRRGLAGSSTGSTAVALSCGPQQNFRRLIADVVGLHIHCSSKIRQKFG